MQTKEKLIGKLFTGKCTKDELEQLFHMIQNDTNSRGPEVMIRLLAQMDTVPPLEPQLSNRIRQKVWVSTVKDSVKKSISSNRYGRPLVSWLPKIAVTVLLLTTAFWIFQESKPESQSVVRTEYGEISEFFLADGSKVTLNGNSSLQFSNDWTPGKVRKVFLTGEAYFQVKRKPVAGTKFLVMTNDLTVEVLGTSFNVRTRNSETTVFLEEGKVKVNLEDESAREVLLSPGEAMHYSALERKLTPPEEIATELLTSWKSGMMEFKNTPLIEILKKLEASNNLSFELENPSLGERIYTLALPTENMDIAMSVLSKTIETSIEKRGNHFIIGIRKQ